MRLSVGMCPSLTAEVVEKLRAQGVKSVRELLLRDCEELARKASVSYRELRSIRRVAIAHHSVFPVSGQDLLSEAIHTTQVLSTGSKELDKLLGGGLATGEVVEVCGQAGEGKTSLCLRLALHTAQELGICVLYVDSMGGLSPLRINPIVEALPQDPKTEEALSRIKVVGAYDVWELFDALTIPTQPFVPVRQGGAGAGAGVTLSKIKLVVVDSVATILFPHICGQQSKQGLAMMNQLAVRLKTLAREQHLAVVVVNDVVQARGGDEDYTTNTTTSVSNSQFNPALGRLWRSVPHIRLYIKRTRQCIGKRLLVKKDSEGDYLAPRSPLELMVAVWKGTRVKERRAVVKFPEKSVAH